MHSFTIGVIVIFSFGFPALGFRCLHYPISSAVSTYRFQATDATTKEAFLRHNNFILNSLSGGSASGTDDGKKFNKYECISCAYVYDEATGFKKRIPPGTKFDSMKTFMCPVCGAAKDQFRLVKEDS